MIEDWLGFITARSICVGAAILVALAVEMTMRLVARRRAWARVLMTRARNPFGLLVLVCGSWIGLHAALPDSPVLPAISHALTIVAIAALAWLLAALVHFCADLAVAHNPIDVRDNGVARRLRTQTIILRRLAIALIVVIALGAALLALAGFTAATLGMALVLGLVLLAVALKMPTGLPRGKKGTKFSAVFSKDANINALSLARVFLFGARDVWFVVGIPVYFYAVLSDGSEAGNRAAFFTIGTFMAVWTILYGAVQAYAPRALRAATRPEAQIIAAARNWALALTTVPAALAALVVWTDGPTPALTATLIAGLLLFGALFAVNSALHSYLILAFSKGERVTLDVGFYYMANAAGRLLGTLLSGLTYQIGGVALCLATAAVMLGLSAIGAGRLRPE
mgnify:CR=1 FL=1